MTSRNKENNNKTLGGIPKIIHQIWIGNSKPPKLNSLYMDTCRMDGWKYKLWSDDDITEKNFPLTFDLIQDIVQVGKIDKKLNKKLAQIADLMRLEILYRNGGVYIDTTAECLKNLDGILDRKNYKFVVSNEDPCGFECKNSYGNYYISNSFIASTKGNQVLKNLLNENKLKKIDIFSYNINHETGPFFLGRYLRRLRKKHNIIMLPSDLIYPTRYRTRYDIERPDLCYKYSRDRNTNLELRNKNDERIFLEYPCKSYPESYVIKHFEAGGTWL